MKIAKVLALLGLLAMTVVLIYGFTVGDFSGEGAKLLAMPWGIVSLVDLYVGFALFSCWIVFREKNLLPSVIWVILMMVLGFWAGALYSFIALQTSHGDWKRFWFGKRAQTGASS
jgi:hypothetical protein